MSEPTWGLVVGDYRTVAGRPTLCRFEVAATLITSPKTIRDANLNIEILKSHFGVSDQSTESVPHHDHVIGLKTNPTVTIN